MSSTDQPLLSLYLKIKKLIEKKVSSFYFQYISHSLGPTPAGHPVLIKTQHNQKLEIILQ